MTRFTMRQIIREANNSDRKEMAARKIGTMLAHKYVFPNKKKLVPDEQKIFFSKSMSCWIHGGDLNEEFTPFIRLYGYFSPTEVPGYKSPYEDVFVLRDPSEFDKYYTTVRQKEKTKLTRKVIRGMKAEELQAMCDHAFDEENLVGYWYEEQEDEKTGIVSFKVNFNFIS